MAWMDNIKTWTGLSVEESIRMTEDRDKWRKYVQGRNQPSDRGRLSKEQNSYTAVGTSSTTNPRQFEVMELKHYSRRTCIKLRGECTASTARCASTVVNVVCGQQAL